MITLLTALFVGLYWLFTNTIILPSFALYQNYGTIMLIELIEVFVEIMIVSFCDTILKDVKYNKDVKE